MAKLWQKDYTLNSLLESFTVGQDYLLDRELVRADCMGSVAHSRGLVKAGLLAPEEQAQIEGELRKIAQEALTRGIVIEVSDEDCHTKIEALLTEALGEAGKKVHLGRSRNDQVLTMIRLYGKDRLLLIRKEILGLCQRLISFAESYKDVPMPGRTHMQVAMPSSLGLWAAAFADQVLDDYHLLVSAWKLLDRSPLGAAASYGTPLPLDREYTARIMGFSELQQNVLAANNSRGKVEATVLDALDHLGISLSKLAQDLILFSLPEFAYFSLPDELTTGSSVMPQKKNPDGLELMRARSAGLSAWASQAKGIIRSLPSGYNRDFQDTKEPFLRALASSLDCVRIMDLSLEKLEVHPENLRKGMSPEIYATDDAFSLVEQGMSFRDAYREVAAGISQVKDRDPVEAIKRRTSLGTSGNLGLERYLEKIKNYLIGWQKDQDQHLQAVRDCLGSDAGLA